MSKGPKYNWFFTENQNRDEWERLCPVNEYRIVKPSEMPIILPAGLTNKYDSVFIMASGTSSGIAYYMANGNRVDLADQAIDQMPFGFGFVGPVPIASGCLIQHGNWEDRTIYPPADFWTHVSNSSIANYYPITTLPEKPSGSIFELEVKVQPTALQKLLEKIKTQFEK